MSREALLNNCYSCSFNTTKLMLTVFLVVWSWIKRIKRGSMQ